MNKFSIVFIVLITINYTAISQTVEPSAAINKNTLQFEIESLYTIQKEETMEMKSWSIPSALFRIGLLKGFEFQINTPIIKEELWENDHLIHSLNKFDDIQAGFSINLWKEKNSFPEASIMIRAILPTDSEFKLSKLGKICSLNFSNTLSEKLSINYNFGYAIETDASKSGFYIANFTYKLSDKIHFFAENFGDFTNHKLISHNLNIGGGYNFSNNFAFDLSVANGINHHMFYVGGIVTYVINTKKS
ncbi:transporter [Lutibacter sp.]|uniref:transporter n=1 Tax=Lutibacter sp. TaxID=1925666 RepID=UPI001A2D7418|nr:transporter [Lutibacter sp.]MBI9040281.1 transporter [Lutibacter sp.]